MGNTDTLPLPEIMRALIRKLSMLENHRLLRWGTINGSLNIGFGLTALISSLVLFLVTDSILQKDASKHAGRYQDERSIITNTEDPGQLRAYALEVSHHHQRQHAAYSRLSRGILKIACIFMGVAGVLYVSLGFTIFRARQLALEVEENRPS